MGYIYEWLLLSSCGELQINHLIQQTRQHTLKKRANTHKKKPTQTPNKNTKKKNYFDWERVR